ncbi:AI-2E family transporter [Proteobacteria bacterium 005FR1]|nr:AI-2E family transporter [Proteobacteria bacterium 005FR1]
MPDVSRNEFTHRAFIVAAIAAALFILWHLGSILMLTFGGVVIAVVIRLAADPLAHLLNVRERWASVIVLLVIFSLLAVATYFFGNKVVSQFGELKQRLPQAFGQIMGYFGAGGEEPFEPEKVLSASRLITAASSTYTFAVDFILVLLVAVYLSFNPSLYRRGFLNLVPPKYRDQSCIAMSTAGEGLRGWLQGQLVSMATVGVLTGLGLWLVGVPLALSLGLIAGLLEFIPIIGPFLAAIPGILLALTVNPTAAVYAAVVYFAVQQLETNLITPLAQRWAVSLPPALGLVGLVIFGSLFGLPGLLFAAPLTVVLMVLVQRFYMSKQPLE